MKDARFRGDIMKKDTRFRGDLKCRRKKLEQAAKKKREQIMVELEANPILNIIYLATERCASPEYEIGDIFEIAKKAEKKIVKLIN